MSSRKPMILRYPLLAAALLLTGCGFHSVYGSHGNAAVAGQLSDVAINNIPDRPGQILRNDLIDRMYGKSGRPAVPKYRLDIKLHTGEEDIGLLADATTARALTSTYAEYALMDLSGKVLTKGSAHSVTSFDTLDQQYATQVARDEAVERTVNEVSNQIVNAISLYFAEKPGN